MLVSTKSFCFLIKNVTNIIICTEEITKKNFTL